MDVASQELAEVAVQRSTPDARVTIASLGFWSLSRLGFGEQHVGAEQSRAILAAYLLPRTATQGPKTWYVLNLHFVLALDPESPGGRVYLTASTNQRAAAQLRFDVVRSGSRMVVHWDSLGLVDGRRDYYTFSHTIEGSFQNYLQTHGVREGANSLELGVERYGDAGVQNVVILGDSGIEVITAAPPRLSLLPIVARASTIRVGDTFTVQFEVAPLGKYPVTSVLVLTRHNTNNLLLLGRERWEFASLAGTAQGNFRFQAIGPGRHRILLLARSDNAGVKTATLEVPVI